MHMSHASLRMSGRIIGPRGSLRSFTRQVAQNALVTNVYTYIGIFQFKFWPQCPRRENDDLFGSAGWCVAGGASPPVRPGPLGSWSNLPPCRSPRPTLLGFSGHPRDAAARVRWSRFLPLCALCALPHCYLYRRTARRLMRATLRDRARAPSAAVQRV